MNYGDFTHERRADLSLQEYAVLYLNAFCTLSYLHTVVR